MGAGASKPFGPPDMANLTRSVELALESKGYGNVLHKVNEDLKRLLNYREDEIDIELTFTVLDSLLDPDKVLKEMGPLAVYLGRRPELGKSFSPESLVDVVHDVANDLRSELKPGNLDEMRTTAENVILNSCRELEVARLVSSHDDLVRISAGQNVMADGGRIGENVLSPIVTTNYDLAMERYRRARSLPKFNRGLTPDPTDGQLFLQPSNLRQSQLTIGLLKLHGSIDWAVREDGRIVEREGLESFYGERFSGRLMVYPVYEKHVSQEPYSSLFVCFKNLLSRSYIYLVMGYSFRDPSINNAFLDALQEDRRRRIIIVNPNPVSVIEHVEFPEAQSTFVQAPFGEHATLDHIQTALRDSSQRHIPNPEHV